MLELKRKLLKLLDTLRICGIILMARTFGEYVHSGWDGTTDYHLYRWRGMKVVVPSPRKGGE